MNASAELIERHMALVPYCLSHLPFPPLPQLEEDLVGVGYLALCQAAVRYDPARGHPFTSIAVPTILGRMQHYIRDSTWGRRVKGVPPLVHFEDLVDGEGDGAGSTDSPFAEACGADLWRLAGELPREERVAVILHYGAGMTETETGRQMGVSQMQAHRRIIAGVARLAARYAE